MVPISVPPGSAHSTTERPSERSQPAIAYLKTLGICAHLTKPFTPEEVLAAVTAILAEAGERRAS